MTVSIVSFLHVIEHLHILLYITVMNASTLLQLYEAQNAKYSE